MHEDATNNMLNMVYSENNLSDELNTRMDILKMMYSVVKPLSNEIIYCEQDEVVTIVNKNGIEIATGTKDNLKRVGTFLILIDKKSNIVTIYSYSTNRKIDIKDTSIISYINFKEVSDDILQIELVRRNILINRYLEILVDIDTYTMHAYIQSEYKICLKFSVDVNRNCTAYLNRVTGRMESYDQFDLDEHYSCLATDFHKKTGVSINKDCTACFKYKLVRDGVIISQKSYEDIIKPSELSNTNTFYTIGYNKNSSNPIKKGLIRDDGAELLSADYDNIQYVGAENYILTLIQNNIQYSAIYNSKSGVVYGFDELANALVHRNLPMVVLYLRNNTIKLLTTNGLVIEPAEISKYFKCSYSQQRPDIIRVELEYGKKYINNALMPITNMHEIAKLSTHTWIPM